MLNSRRLFDDEEYRRRCVRRLQEELGIDPQDVDVILHLQEQIIQLHEQVRQLEQELESRRGGRASRLRRYQWMVVEASWYETEED